MSEDQGETGMAHREQEPAAGREAPEHHSGSGVPFLHRPVAVVTLISGIVAILSGIVGVIISIDGDDDKQDEASGVRASDIQRFEGIAGHLAESRAIVSFLEQHDGEVVYLDVGFPPILGPGSGDNLLAESVAHEDGTSLEIVEIDLMTECDAPGLDLNNPTPRDGCMGVALRISRPQNPDAQTFFEHGVPRVKGYFRVDVTGGLYQGLRPIGLQPLTFDEAIGE